MNGTKGIGVGFMDILSLCKWIFFAKYYYEPFQLFVFLPSVLELICVNCLIKGY